MRHWIRLPTLAAFCCSVVACMSGTPAQPAAPATAWQVSVSVQGGIAGIDQQFSADSTSATLRVADAVRQTTSAVALTAGQRQEISALVSGASSLPDIDRRSPRCRDCLAFDLSIYSGAAAKPRRVQLDSTTMDESPEARLIQRLVAIGRAGTTP